MRELSCVLYAEPAMPIFSLTAKRLLCTRYSLLSLTFSVTKRYLQEFAVSLGHGLS